MIRIRRLTLPVPARTGLVDYQKIVDGHSTYAARVEAAKGQFKQRNQKTDPVFKPVRATLTKMCRGARRCMYCEDAPADEVEHFRPKDLFPERVFDWSNYLYSCGLCNGPKNNKWGILPRRGSVVSEVARARGAGVAVVPPPRGQPALIDPGREDPLRFLIMDLAGTFVLLPIPALVPRDRARAEYTIEVLDLNKDFLLESRESALEAYVSHLERARREKSRGAGGGLDTVRKAIQNTYHPTVWAEMKRQRAIHPRLEELFSALPEAMSW